MKKPVPLRQPQMYIPEFVCGILATIGVEIILLIGYAIFRKK